MRKVDDRLELSASDLASHFGRLQQRGLLVAGGGLVPPRWRDPTLEVLQQRGLELAQLYLIRSLIGSTAGISAIKDSRIQLSALPEWLRKQQRRRQMFGLKIEPTIPLPGILPLPLLIPERHRGRIVDCALRRTWSVPSPRITR